MAAPLARWSNVADWCYAALGAILIVIGLVLDSAETWSALILGVVMIGSALWDLSVPSIAATWVEGIIAFVVFLLPWFSAWLPSAFSPPASWLTWIIGVLGIICAAWAWASHTEAN